MTKKIVLAILVIQILSCQTKKKEHSEEFIKTQNELTEKLTKISTQSAFNGFGVALTNDKEVLYQNGFGLANLEKGEKYTENTIQNIASVSKTFVGIAMLKAQELGKLKLDDPISKYLPYKIENPKFRQTPITIRQLVTHTSSIRDNEEYLHRAWVLEDTVNLEKNLKIDIGVCKFSAPSTAVSMEDFLINVLTEKGKWFKPTTFNDHKPGLIFEYSNMGTTLAALILEKATGEKFDEFTAKYIFQPLKMESTGWTLRSVDMKKHSRLYINKKTAYPFYSCITYPDGSVITSTKDMSKYIGELMKGYTGNGTLLSKNSYKELFTQQLKAENFIDRSASEYSDEYNIGILMGFGSTGNFGHTGGDPGMFSVIWFDKNTKTGRYFIINTDWDDKNSGKSQKEIYDLLDEYSIKLNKLSKEEK
ncbi:serine hydrolase [Flavobacterium sp.]|uniref:serine hydrolase domain-containing protein n=1 Tax=Flavobacterium sp. TaxID=239 RepID=UPI0025BA1779|nr:serine hydrolase domain-containing protein [Flavobacterium sp.]MBA4155182.1 serine hydrolase [Flavobacterium sp.]